MPKNKMHENVERLSKDAIAKLNYGTQNEKTQAIGMLKIIDSIRQLIKSEPDDKMLLKKLKEIFE